jgi:hypothetical protein
MVQQLSKTDQKRLEAIDRRMAKWRYRIGNSYAKARQAMCLICMGGEINEIPRCTSKTCPLYPFRDGKPDDRIKNLNRGD